MMTLVEDRSRLGVEWPVLRDASGRSDAGAAGRSVPFKGAGARSCGDRADEVVVDGQG